MTDVKRVQYYDHQFLRVAEFTDEQGYHRRMRRVHNSTLHTPGIASGLDVTVVQGATHVRVAPGAALDANGQDIVLDAEFQLELGGLPADQDAFVVISWQERSTDPATDGSGHDTRWTEAPKVEGMTSQPTDGLHLVLARVKRQGTIVQPNPDLSGRRVAGVTAGDLALSTLRLRSAGVVATSWPTFTAPAAKSARLEGALSVDGALVVDGANAGAGTKDPGLMFGAPSGEAIASSRAANAPNRFGLDFFTNSLPRLSIDNAGRVGVGVRIPQATLDVQGGEIRWGNNSRLVNDQGGSIELGGVQGVAGSGSPYIDFHFSGLNQDFNTRIINDADGVLSLIAPTVTVKGQLTVDPGALRIRAFPTNDTTSLLTTLSFVGRGAGGNERSWNLYTAAVGGGFGVEPNGFELWQYPETVSRFKIRANGDTLLAPSGGNVIVGPVPAITRNFMVHGGEVHSGGGGAGYSFQNRNQSGAFQEGAGVRWVIYSQDGLARIWTSGDVMTIASDGTIGTRGMHARNGLPSGWGGGVHTFDVYAEATIAAGPSGGPPRAWINSAGQLAASQKNFIIDHPEEPEKRDLVHATLEGPEHAVIYRGEGTLVDGAATVELPSYFEPLTRVDGRTVLVTPRVAPGGRVAVLGASEVRQGSFTVRAADEKDATSRFWWQVIAVRGDVDVLEDEPVKSGARMVAEEKPKATRRRTAKKAAAKR
jgi:hypothetical protein